MSRSSLSFRAAVALCVTAGLVLGLAGAPGARSSLALLTSRTSIVSNTFSTRPDWVPPSMTNPIVAMTSVAASAGILWPGATFYTYATVADAGSPASGVASVNANLSAVVQGATATPLVAGTYAFGNESFNYRSAPMTAGWGLPNGPFNWSMTAADVAGNATTVTLAATVNTGYVLKATTANIGTNCQAGANGQSNGGQFDMEIGFVPTGTESSHSGPGPRDIVTWCSPTFGGGATLRAGTSIVTLNYRNVSTTKACTLTVSLSRNTTLLGSLAQSISMNTTRTIGSWSFATAATTFSAGDRLNLQVDWAGGNSCNSTTVYWGGPSSVSRIILP